MSHAGSQITCPNCSFHTTENYCARCGQEVHLHDDTVRGLVLHFAGHYFHYESKFWSTLKTLWFRPGELTLAYWNRQRMRFLSPISLYIFLSALFFLTSTLFPDSGEHRSATHTASVTREAHADESHDVFTTLGQRIYERRRLLDADSHSAEKFAEKLIHTVPKIFFFMIPLMAVLLRVLFFNRPQKIVHHTIFSLHAHALWFSVITILNLYPFEAFSNLLTGIILTAGCIYFILALKRTYNTGWIKAVVFSLITGVVYLITFFAAFVGLVLFL